MIDFDPLEVLWCAIALTGLYAAARAHVIASDRLEARRDPATRALRNGPRLYLARGRVFTARMHVLAFGLWVLAGALAIAQPAGETYLRPYLIAALIGGFVSEAAAIVVGNRRDERLENMLAQPADAPRRRKDDN